MLFGLPGTDRRNPGWQIEQGQNCKQAGEGKWSSFPCSPFSCLFRRYGQDLEKLEKITLNCIGKMKGTIAATEEKPWSPQGWVEEYVCQILGILVSFFFSSIESVSVQ